MPTRHNPVARSPLLRKGGVHVRSRSGERQVITYNMRNEAANYLSEDERTPASRPSSRRRKPVKESCP